MQQGVFGVFDVEDIENLMMIVPLEQLEGFPVTNYMLDDSGGYIKAFTGAGDLL